ncbi:MAG: hypothetical protein U0934_02015 [Pseudotabrizicola sp.]|uniref:hypothetical protein n=1 Tax=Pseudotabrizicola sp. TaxID=2939647 RepID=UPI002730E2CD|nr:hypothetical protein [Pseudotabrizicola sp.]MDP2080881.1 hypothetical protein [Pseudotabrizicola sp.]MDZ7572717.1 hypothetical protein [Pseudotabrizicola sp.]
MSLIRSREQLQTPWRDLLTAAVAAVLLPSGLGIVCLGIFSLVQQIMPATAGISLWVIGTALMLSPILSLVGMILALPVASLLIRLGWFGWVPAAATGLVIGGVIGAMMDFAPGALAGAAIVLILRATLGLLRPMRAL